MLDLFLHGDFYNFPIESDCLVVTHPPTFLPFFLPYLGFYREVNAQSAQTLMPEALLKKKARKKALNPRKARKILQRIH